jgi:hypothetical protein
MSCGLAPKNKNDRKGDTSQKGAVNQNSYAVRAVHMSDEINAFLVVGSFFIVPVAGVAILAATGATLGATILACPTIFGGALAVGGAKRIYDRLTTPKDQPRPAIVDTGELVILSATGIAGAFMLGGPVVGLVAFTGITHVLPKVEGPLGKAPALQKAVASSSIDSFDEDDLVVISSK